jgi:hypothetical protein
VLLETVRVCVDGYAKGLWNLRPEKLDAGKGGGLVRVAPGFSAVGRGSLDRQENPLIYTATTVARETGAPLWKVDEALRTLALDEAGTVPEKLTAGMTVSAARDARNILARVEHKTKSSMAVEEAARQIKAARRKEGRDAQRATMARIANKVIKKHAPAAVDYGQLARRYAERLAALFTSGKTLFEELKAIVEHADKVPERYQKSILSALRSLAAKATNAADNLEKGVQPRPERKLLKGEIEMAVNR